MEEGEYSDIALYSTGSTACSYAVTMSLVISHRRVLPQVVALDTAVLIELWRDRDPALLRL